MKYCMAIPMHGLSGLAWQNIGKIFALAFGLTFVSFGTSMATEQTSPAKVGVYAKHVGNKIVYYYRVINKSPLDITAVSIGYDTQNDNDPGNDVWELSELPSGWNPKLGIPAANSNSPMGWRVSMTAPDEESKTHALTWEIANDKSPVLSSGQTLAKMSIALDKADMSHLAGHALVTFSDGAHAAVAKGAPAAMANGSPAAAKVPPLNVSVPIDSLDNSPPVLAVTLTPNTVWPPDNKYIPVNVTFATKEDNFDSLPEIKLESITANEPLEPGDISDASYGLDDRYLRLRSKRNGSTNRIYTVIYSATDASGNQATASATVTVTAAAPAAVAPAATPATPATATPAATPAPATAAKTPATAPPDQGKKVKIEAR